MSSPHTTMAPTVSRCNSQSLVRTKGGCVNESSTALSNSSRCIETLKANKNDQVASASSSHNGEEVKKIGNGRLELLVENEDEDEEVESIEADGAVFEASCTRDESKNEAKSIAEKRILTMALVTSIVEASSAAKPSPKVTEEKGKYFEHGKMTKKEPTEARQSIGHASSMTGRDLSSRQLFDTDKSGMSGNEQKYEKQRKEFLSVRFGHNTKAHGNNINVGISEEDALTSGIVSFGQSTEEVKIEDKDKRTKNCGPRPQESQQKVCIGSDSAHAVASFEACNFTVRTSQDSSSPALVTPLAPESPSFSSEKICSLSSGAATLSGNCHSSDKVNHLVKDGLGDDPTLRSAMTTSQKKISSLPSSNPTRKPRNTYPFVGDLSKSSVSISTNQKYSSFPIAFTRKHSKQHQSCCSGITQPPVGALAARAPEKSTFAMSTTPNAHPKKGTSFETSEVSTSPRSIIKRKNSSEQTPPHITTHAKHPPPEALAPCEMKLTEQLGGVLSLPRPTDKTSRKRKLPVGVTPEFPIIRSKCVDDVTVYAESTNEDLETNPLLSSKVTNSALTDAKGSFEPCGFSSSLPSVKKPYLAVIKGTGYKAPSNNRKTPMINCNTKATPLTDNPRLAVSISGPGTTFATTAASLIRAKSAEDTNNDARTEAMHSELSATSVGSPVMSFPTETHIFVPSTSATKNPKKLEPNSKPAKAPRTITHSPTVTTVRNNPARPVAPGGKFKHGNLSPEGAMIPGARAAPARPVHSQITTPELPQETKAVHLPVPNPLAGRLDSPSLAVASIPAGGNGERTGTVLREGNRNHPIQNSALTTTSTSPGPSTLPQRAGAKGEFPDILHSCQMISSGVTCKTTSLMSASPHAVLLGSNPPSRRSSEDGISMQTSFNSTVAGENPSLQQKRPSQDEPEISATNELPPPVRGRIFSIDLDPAVLDFVENVADPLTHEKHGATSPDIPLSGNNSIALGVHAASVGPQLTDYKNSAGSVTFKIEDDTLSQPGSGLLRRDRGFSFEFFSFGINEDEPLPPAPALMCDGNENGDECKTNEISFGNRVRGDSIIFDPTSFRDGGIHETSALMHIKQENEFQSTEENPSDEVISPGVNHSASQPLLDISGNKLVTKITPSTPIEPENVLSLPPIRPIDKQQSLLVTSASATNVNNAAIPFNSRPKQLHFQPHLNVKSRGISATVSSTSTPDANTAAVTDLVPQFPTDNTLHMPHGSDAAAAATAGTSPPIPTSCSISATDSISLSHTACPMDLLNKGGRIGIYLPEERKARIAKFHSKRKIRIWRKRIKYDCRKKLADSRPRIKGRFVKRSDVDIDGEEGEA